MTEDTIALPPLPEPGESLARDWLWRAIATWSMVSPNLAFGEERRADKQELINAMARSVDEIVSHRMQAYAREAVRLYIAGRVGDGHDSDCATHNEPAYPAGPCDCSANQARAGWILVPLDPPDAIWEAWRSCCRTGDPTVGMAEFTYFNGDYGNWLYAWQTMLAAAASTPPPEDDDVEALRDTLRLVVQICPHRPTLKLVLGILQIEDSTGAVIRTDAELDAAIAKFAAANPLLGPLAVDRAGRVGADVEEAKKAVRLAGQRLADLRIMATRDRATHNEVADAFASFNDSIDALAAAPTTPPDAQDFAHVSVPCLFNVKGSQ